MDTAQIPSLSEITNRIVDAMHPRRILLFGSRAQGNARADSDFDLMIEMDTDLRPMERARRVYRLFGPRRWSMDVVVYTPQEVRERRNYRNSLIHAIEREGQVLYVQS
jgi:predicted nucleotidyltransferase